MLIGGGAAANHERADFLLRVVHQMCDHTHKGGKSDIGAPVMEPLRKVSLITKMRPSAKDYLTSGWVSFAPEATTACCSSSVEGCGWGKYFVQAVAALDEVGQGVAVEGGEEAVAGLRDSPRKSADICDDAAIAFDIEAFHRFKRPLGVTDNFPDIDCGRIARQLDTAALAAIAFYESAASKVVHDLDEMVARDAVTLGYLRDVGEAVARTARYIRTRRK